MKTDAVDAAIVAQLLRVDLIPEAQRIAKELATIVYAMLTKEEAFNDKLADTS